MAIELKLMAIAFLAAFGIAAPVPEFLAGLILAIACCYAVFLFTEVKSRISLWATLFVGVLVAVLSAIAHPHLSWVDWLPVQMVMAAAGALSKFIVEGAISFGKGLIEWFGELPSKFTFGDKE